MTDKALVEHVLAVTGLSARALAPVMAVDESTVRRWLMAGKQPSKRQMPGPARQLLRALAHEPSLVLLLG